MNAIFKALSEPTRREILMLLGSGEKSAGELAQHFENTWPTISHHLSVLKDAELVESRRDGTTIYYSLNTTVLQDLMTWVVDLKDRKNRKRRKSS